ncbi:beta-glucosidase BglX [Exiguobacterium sp. BMC-KP]|uniref:beta-glucosidase BglX n=1 Tax=Exiguobacterium sp. BMC-KP TaxID=1684312 RepID=UPI0009EAE132|nr:beta-glucosidase BglX [Exiguobacterium sp. BMC-KP]
MNIESLLEQMTLQEKIGQLVQILPSVYDPQTSDTVTGPVAQLMEESGLTEENRFELGSVIGINQAEQALRIQQNYLKHNRLGIPLLFMADIVHGHRTIYPVPLALASMWDISEMELMARQSAIEAAASGLHVTFSPMVDLVRDARWGRVMESTGEDVWLNGEYAKAFVRGYQTDDLTRSDSLAACVKHFAAYGAAEGGRDYNTVDMSDRELREFYLPAYLKAIEAGARLIMTSFNVVDGVPATASTYLLRQILRNEWQFDGVTISDWSSIKELIQHGVAGSLAEAGEKGIKAGVDIDMMSGAYLNHLEQQIEEHVVSIDLVDEAVRRILILKRDLGLFENPYRGIDPELEKRIHLSKEHRDTARRLAEKSCVLLKNDHILPLAESQRIALIGPFATSTDVLGPWAGSGKQEEAITVRDALDEANIEYVFAEGSTVDAEIDWDQAMEVAKQAEVILLALGEASWMSGEAGSRTDIRLPKTQREGLARLATLGKPIVTVLFNGRPLDLRDVVEHSDAVLEAWYPGTEAGRAIHRLLYGHAIPSGKLTISFPYHVGQLPIRYDALPTGRPMTIEGADPRYTSKYLDAPNEALFPFGYGLSYTHFSYSQLTLCEQSKESIWEASVLVTNEGTLDAEEIVQWYVQDPVADVSRPLRQLKGYERVFVKAGSNREVTFRIDASMLMYQHPDGSVKADAGEFILYAGSDSACTLHETFWLKQTVEKEQFDEHINDRSTSTTR